jgi:hypothetical protein
MQQINIGGFCLKACTAIAEHEDGRREIIHWNVKMADRVSRERLERTPRTASAHCCRGVTSGVTIGCNALYALLLYFGSIILSNVLIHGLLFLFVIG